ncbi:neuroplastin-like isoform X2 [Centruroides vittatus]|uniref:neuroplastin-like isoform X2 n=1 Tax=Centruroides vittatus TaxID=120091 RepID=UPI00350EF4B4
MAAEMRSRRAVSGPTVEGIFLFLLLVQETKKFEYLLAPNQTLELFCDLGEKTDRVRVRWYKDEKRIEDGRVKIEDKRLTVENSDQGDGGEYSCEVESDEDRQKVTYVGKVFPVYSAPGIRPFPPTLSFLNGSDLVLECHVFGGYPEPKIRWLVGNEAADRRPDYDERLLVMPGGPGPNAVLYVDRVDYSDRNRYTCLAENAVGQAEASVWVTVRDNMIKTNEAEAGKGLILLPGKQLVLQCETTVCVNCTVEWLKDGEHLNKSDERIRIHDANNSLIISKARVSDTGDYMCFVNKSVIGEFVNATIVVRPKTQVEQFDKSINLVQGNKLNLHCNVKVGIPVPTISWYKDGQLLNGSDDRIGFSEDDKGIPNAILTIDELEYTDRANYMCEADNGISSSNATTLVRVKDKLAALWPFLGICAEVIILCTIIFIYEKKKVKEVNNPDVDQIAESRNVPERGRSQEIRQRK